MENNFNALCQDKLETLDSSKNPQVILSGKQKTRPMILTMHVQSGTQCFAKECLPVAGKWDIIVRSKGDEQAISNWEILTFHTHYWRRNSTDYCKVKNLVSTILNMSRVAWQQWYHYTPDNLDFMFIEKELWKILSMGKLYIHGCVRLPPL